MTFQKYVYREYSKEYPKLFKQEKAKLRRILPKDAVIEHGGSSAVPGLGGKGIIDIFISVKKRDLKKSIGILQDEGYVYKPNPKIKNRKYFERHYVDWKSGNERRVHLHLNYHGSFDMRRAMAFRDYLIKNPQVVKEYAKIKKGAVKHAKGEGEKYREYKHKFLQKIGREAMKSEKVKKFIVSEKANLILIETKR